jgi:pimeloyl-ACP methyl ester carboxylesterase
VLESVAMNAAILALALGTKRIPGWRGRSRTWFALLAVQLATSVSISVQYLGGLMGLGVSQRLAVLSWAASVALAGWSLVRGANQAWPQPTWPVPPPLSFRRLGVPIAGQPGTVVNAEVHHPERPETVLVLSGLGLPLELWYPVVAAVPQACLVLVDRPGLGGSSAWHHPPTGLADQFAVLDAVLDAAGRSGPVVLVGHSYGGLLAQAYARLRPQEVSALVLVDSSDPDEEAVSLAPSPKVLRLVDRFTSTRWGAGLAGRAARWLIISVGTARVDAMRPPRLRIDASTVRRQLNGTMAELGAIRSAAAELARAIEGDPVLGVPSRLLICRWGGWPLYREQRRWISRQVQRGEVIRAQPVVHCGAHLLMLDNPTALADSITWAVAQATGR